jgi:hypothetical protein
MHDHERTQNLTLGVFPHRIHAMGRDRYPFPQAAGPAPACRGSSAWRTGRCLLFQCSLLTRQQLADTAQRQIVAEDAKAGYRSTADTGHL